MMTLEAKTTSKEAWEKEWAKPEVSRLPHNSEYLATYDADKVMWTVSLRTTINGQDESLCVEAHGLFPALMKLDALYRTKAGLPKRRRFKKDGKRKTAQL
jgi:hypothetical protein